MTNVAALAIFNTI